MQIQLNIEMESAKEAERAAIEETVKIINQKFGLAILFIKPEMAEFVRTTIKASDEFHSIVNGELRKHFGLSDPGPIMEEVVEAIVRVISFKFDKIVRVGDGVKGGLTVAFLTEDFVEVLAVPGTSYISETKAGGNTKQTRVRNSGRDIPAGNTLGRFGNTPAQHLIEWMSWLLFEGTAIIIRNYEIVFGEFPGSRSGGALMRDRKFGVWSVPKEFAGTKQDNFLTRAFYGKGEIIDKIMQEGIEKILK